MMVRSFAWQNLGIMCICDGARWGRYDGLIHSDVPRTRDLRLPARGHIATMHCGALLTLLSVPRTLGRRRFAPPDCRVSPTGHRGCPWEAQAFCVLYTLHALRSG